MGGIENTGLRLVGEKWHTEVGTIVLFMIIFTVVIEEMSRKVHNLRLGLKQ